MRPMGALWRLIISGVVAVILFLLIVSAIQQPVTATNGHTPRSSLTPPGCIWTRTCVSAE